MSNTNIRKDIIEPNKKLFIIIGCVLLAIIIGIAASHWFSDSEEETPALTSSSSNQKLPQFEDINYLESPMMYDFVYGMPGYRSHDIFQQTSITEEFMIAATKNDGGDTLFLTWVDAAPTPYIYPRTSYKPISVDQNYSETLAWLNENNFMSVDEDCNGDSWRFFITTDYSYERETKTLSFGGVSIENWGYKDLDEAPFRIGIINGVGYPASTIRIYPEFVEGLYDWDKTDINDPFWDTYNLESHLLLTVREEKEWSYTDNNGVETFYHNEPLIVSPLAPDSFSVYGTKIVDEEELNQISSMYDLNTIQWAVEHDSFTAESD